MAGLPITLPVGMVAVYGSGQDSFSPFGSQMPTNYRFGTIYHIWDGGAIFVYAGDKITFSEENVHTRIVTEDGETFTVVPARLAIVETEEILL